MRGRRLPTTPQHELPVVTPTAVVPMAPGGAAAAAAESAEAASAEPAARAPEAAVSVAQVRVQLFDANTGRPQAVDYVRASVGAGAGGAPLVQLEFTREVTFAPGSRLVVQSNVGGAAKYIK